MIDPQLIKCVREAFPKWQGEATPGLRLGDLPEWDSMNAVNLQLELESAFGVDLQGFDLGGDTTLGQVAQRVSKN